MPVIRPFRGVRYNPEIVGDISAVVAPPYDIVYDEWREKLYERNPYNIIRLIKTKEESTDTENENKYTRAARYIESWFRDEVLTYEDDPAIYVCADTYEINGETKVRYGFIAILKVEDYGNTIHPHERTLSGPMEDRLKLVRATQTNLSQIFSIFRDPENHVQDVMMKTTEAPPDIYFTDEQGIIRRLWVVKDPGFISTLQNLMKNRDIIIADGHHRYETAIHYKKHKENERQSEEEPFDYVSMYFSNADDSGMSILPTHRKISGVSVYNQETFFSELKKSFNVVYLGECDLQEVIKLIAVDSEHNNAYGIYTCDGFGTAQLRNPSNPKELDVDILHNIIIEKLLGISREDIASGRHVHFCKSPEHAIEDVSNHKDQISFIMNAIRPEELFRKVLQGVRMPQKSTYFYPKTLSGLVMYKIDKQSLG